MEIRVSQEAIQESKADTIIVNLFEGVTVPAGAAGATNQALSGAIGELVANGDFSGKAGEIGVIYPRGAILAKRVLVAGLGKKDEFNQEAARRAVAVAVKKARDLNAKDVATIVHGSGQGGMSVSMAAQATAEGALLGLYEYAAPRQKNEPKNQIRTLTIVEYDKTRLADVQAGVKVAEAIAAGVRLTRDLVNMPPNVATPTKLAEVAGEIAKAHNMQLTVGDVDWATERHMGAYLAVARGAGTPPKFIVLEHNRQRPGLDTVVLVGKGITFDSGGISLKPSEHMGDMKSDMAGAGAVLGAMKVVGLLDLPLHVIGITPCTENMPDAGAYHPADIITASNGKTIEIISTDAEGRMILADALVYASQYQPKAVVDLATLTGACVVALGENIAAGLFCNDERLQSKLVASGEATHERVWPMPLWNDYKKAIKSEVADIKNSGGRSSGVGSSAIFLNEFASYPWAHIDMAGMALLEKRLETPYVPEGGTGYGVRLLVDFLRNW